MYGLCPQDMIFGRYLKVTCITEFSVTMVTCILCYHLFNALDKTCQISVTNLPYHLYISVSFFPVAIFLGYKALMRYEGFGNDFSKDFWVNICNKDIHPVGWCATSGKPLVPPKSMYIIAKEG